MNPPMPHVDSYVLHVLCPSKAPMSLPMPLVPIPTLCSPYPLCPLLCPLCPQMHSYELYAHPVSPCTHIPYASYALYAPTYAPYAFYSD